MIKSPRQQIALAGFTAGDTDMLLSVYNSVRSGYSSPSPQITAAILAAVVDMAGIGTRAPWKIAAYASRRAQFIANGADH
ncbi:hypothetical protein ACO2I3_06275 [Leptospira interrogans]